MTRTPILRDGVVRSVLASSTFGAIVILVGGVFRVTQYLSGRSLWLDESLLALNVIHRPFSELFATLYYAQGAPPGFLLLERLSVDAFGSSENALRLAPLIAGIAALPLFLYVARRMLGRSAGGAALLLFVALDGPIIYSSEVKQYSTDLCIGLGILAAGLAIEKRSLTVRRAVLVSVLGVIAVWFSHPAIFVLAGVGVALALDAMRERDNRRLIVLLAIGASWSASFGALYLANIRHLPPGLGTTFLPSPTSTQRVHELIADLPVLLNGEFALHLPTPLAILAGVLFLAGVVSLCRQRDTHVVMLALPVVGTIVASAAGLYPWGGRFTLYLLPEIILFTLVGARSVSQICVRSGLPLVVGALPLVLIGLPSLATASWHVVHPQRIEELKPVVRSLNAKFRAGDALYLNTTAQYGVRYYAIDRRLGDHLQLALSPKPGQALQPLPGRIVIGPDRVDPEAIPRKARVWVLLSHFAQFDPARLLTKLDQRGQRLFTLQVPGAILVLYDFTDSRPPKPERVITRVRRVVVEGATENAAIAGRK